MLKFLILLPLLVLFALVGGVALLPLLAIAPVLCVIGLAIALPLMILRVLVHVFAGIGGLLFGIVGLGFAVAGLAALLVFGAVLVHLALPILLIVGLVWLIRHASRPVIPKLEHRPS